MYHRRSIELWLYEELFENKLSNQASFEAFQHLLASITLVDFPQFRDIHNLIPLVLEIRSNHLWGLNDDDIKFNSEKWEIYVEYRKIVSRFLIDHRSRIPRDPRFCSDSFICWSRGGKAHYVILAKRLLTFLSECHS